MRTNSCVIRPPDDTYISIHQCDIDICGGNQCAAALITYFENWHNTRLKNQRKYQQLNDIAEGHGDQRPYDETLWQWHTEKEIIEGIKVFRKDSIAKAIKLLADKQIITISRNPNPRYKFDHTRFFIFHPQTLNRLYAPKAPSAENRSSQTENRSTIELDSLINYKTSPIVPVGDTSLERAAEEAPIYERLPQKETSVPDDKDANDLLHKEGIVSRVGEVVFANESVNTSQPLANKSLVVRSPKTPRPRASSPAALEVLAYLNTVTKRDYRTVGQIQARISAGATVEECKLVIDYLDATWSAKFKGAYLNQLSPFRPDNFDKNLTQAHAWRPAQTASSPDTHPETSDDLWGTVNSSITERKLHAR